MFPKFGNLKKRISFSVFFCIGLFLFVFGYRQKQNRQAFKHASPSDLKERERSLELNLN